MNQTETTPHASAIADQNCVTTPDGDCVSDKECMHSPRKAAIAEGRALVEKLLTQCVSESNYARNALNTLDSIGHEDSLKYRVAKNVTEAAALRAFLSHHDATKQQLAALEQENAELKAQLVEAGVKHFGSYLKGVHVGQHYPNGLAALREAVEKLPVSTRDDNGWDCIDRGAVLSLFDRSPETNDAG